MNQKKKADDKQQSLWVKRFDNKEGKFKFQG